MNINTPICDAIAKYSSSFKHRFHTPGHSGGNIIPQSLKPWGETLWKYDVTEVANLDNLLNENGIIAESESLTAKLYNVTDTLYLTQGSTSGIQIAIMSTVKPGDKVLVERNSHMSIWNSLILSGAEPVWLEPEYDIRGLPEPFNTQRIAQALDANPNIVALVIQNPTYEGKAGNIKELVKIAKHHNIPLIIDEAHGAHFHFSSKLPISAVDAGADIVIQSAHKTLPVLTGGAYLHRQGNLVSLSRLKEVRRIIHSSSPSYLILASLDAAQAYLMKNADNCYNQLFKLISKLYINPSQFKPIHILVDANNRLDYTKINLSFPTDCSGKCINMLNKYGIMFEKSDGRNVLFLANLGTTSDSISELIRGLNSCRNEIPYISQNYDNKVFQVPIIGKNIYKPRDMLYMSKEWIRLERANNRVAADPVVNYPPGVPLLLPGELITKSVIDYIKQVCQRRNIVGLKYKDEILFIRVTK